MNDVNEKLIHILLTRKPRICSVSGLLITRYRMQHLHESAYLCSEKTSFCLMRHRNNIFLRNIQNPRNEEFSNLLLSNTQLTLWPHASHILHSHIECTYIYESYCQITGNLWSWSLHSTTRKMLITMQYAPTSSCTESASWWCLPRFATEITFHLNGQSALLCSYVHTKHSSTLYQIVARETFSILAHI